VAAVKASIERHTAEFLAREPGPANRQLAGTYVLQGPSPYLRICLLLTVWTVLPVLVLRLWKFRCLSVTRDHVVVVAVSKLTLAPRRVVSRTPRDHARIERGRDGLFWTPVRFVDAKGATHRFHVSRPFRADLDRVLAEFGAGPGLRPTDHPAGPDGFAQ